MHNSSWSRSWAVATVLACLMATSARAQGIELRGRVVSDSGTPLRGAVVTLASLRYSVRADTLGQFRLSGTAGGTLELSISAPGFRTQSMSVVLPRSGSLRQDFALASDGTPLPVEPTNVLRGIVTDTDGSPISYANVQVNGGTRIVSSDSGRFSIPYPSGDRITLLVRRIGYNAGQVTIDVKPDSVYSIKLSAAATILPDMQVVGRSPFFKLDHQGFYDRMRESQRGGLFGYFVTPEELDLRKPVNVTDAVDQFPAIRVRPGNAETAQRIINNVARWVPVNHPRNMRIEDQAGCPLTVYLDGIRVQPAMRALSNRIEAGELPDDQINTLIGPGSAAGIEVYPRNTLGPPQYPPVPQTCGVVLIWSK